MNLIKSFFTLKNFSLWALLAMTLIPGIAAALPADRQKPIEIESDSANLDNNKGISVYRGNVIMTQGTTRIQGDLITIYNDKNRKVTRIVAEGKRAYYEEKLEQAKGKLEAWGQTINYNVSGDQIELLKQAELSQDGDIFKGEKIDYNLALQTVNATGQAVKNGSKSRVQMVIQPRQEQNKKATGG